jgi:low affinity Fe/Cu permease
MTNEEKRFNPYKCSIFVRFASKAAHWAGSSYAFIIAVLVILVWAITGPIFDFSDTWQLIINTGTTVVTFLMVFLIQNAQNRDGKAVQLKLDELIRATEGAHTVLLDLEELEEAELEAIRSHYIKIARLGREHLRSGKSDTDIPEVVLDELKL